MNVKVLTEKIILKRKGRFNADTPPTPTLQWDTNKFRFEKGMGNRVANCKYWFKTEYCDKSEFTALIEGKGSVQILCGKDEVIDLTHFKERHEEIVIAVCDEVYLQTTTLSHHMRLPAPTPIKLLEFQAENNKDPKIA